MSLCLIHQSGAKPAPRRAPEAPVIVHRAYPEHIARCIIAVGERRKREGMAVIVEKEVKQ